MNRFLASLEITFRRDPTNFRPRVNKLNSIKDREQKGKSPPSLLFLSPDVVQLLEIISSLRIEVAPSQLCNPEQHWTNDLTHSTEIFGSE